MKAVSQLFVDVMLVLFQMVDGDFRDCEGNVQVGEDYVD